jgi:hypothetical protein
MPMPLNKKNLLDDHDTLQKLVQAFSDFVTQDKLDKQLIREDIQKLSDGLVNRVDIVEKGIQDKLSKNDFGTFLSVNHAPVVADVNKLKDEKADRKDVQMLQAFINDDIDKRVRKLEDKAIYMIAWATGAAAVVALVIDMISRFYHFGS